jgi:hypothetical protein
MGCGVCLCGLQVRSGQGRMAGMELGLIMIRYRMGRVQWKNS